MNAFLSGPLQRDTVRPRFLHAGAETTTGRLLPSWLRSLWLGLAARGAYFGGTLYWIAHVIRTYGGLGVPLVLLIAAALVAYLALFPACFAVTIARRVSRVGSPALVDQENLLAGLGMGSSRRVLIPHRHCRGSRSMGAVAPVSASNGSGGADPGRVAPSGARETSRRAAGSRTMRFPERRHGVVPRRRRADNAGLLHDPYEVGAMIRICPSRP